MKRVNCKIGSFATDSKDGRVIPKDVFQKAIDEFKRSIQVRKKEKQL